MDQIKLASIIRGTGETLYSDKSYNATNNAQGNLMGRTHYVDPDTMRYFHSRITAANDACSGLVFWIVERVAKDCNNTSRGSRPVAFWSWMNTFDLTAHYREALAQRASRAKREHDDLRSAFNATFESE